MVHEKESRVSAFSSGFDSGKVVRKKALGMFDSVRSTSSVEMFSQSSSGGDDTGKIIGFFGHVKNVHLIRM